MFIILPDNNIFVRMKSFRQLCLDRHSSSQRSSLNNSQRSSSLTQSFRSILNKQAQNPQPRNPHVHKTISIGTDTQLFTKLIKQSKQLLVPTEPPVVKPSIKSIKKKIRINRRLTTNQNIHTPIRDMKQRIQQERTTALDLTSTQKKQIESDLSRVTNKIKERLTEKQLTQHSEIESALEEAESDIKGETQRAFERILKKRNCILSSIKSKKSKGGESGEGKISTPRFQESQEEGVGSTDRFQNSLIDTIEQVLSKISIQPLLTEESKGTLKSQRYREGDKENSMNSNSRVSFNGKFSTKSIKNRLLNPPSSNHSSFMN